MKQRNFDETRQKIISAAAYLFIKHGWDKISIQNIVDEVGDITRGAFYHHFKTKNDVIEAVSIELFDHNSEHEELKFKKNMNALEKFRQILRYTLTTPSKYGLMASLDHLVKTPEYLFKLYNDGKNYTTTQIEQLIIEGNEDGSMNVLYPKASAEALAILFNFWLTLDINEVTKKEYQEKVELLKIFSDNINLRVIDEEMKKHLLANYDMTKEKNK